MTSTTLHTLRVFLGPDGGGGNPLGDFLHGAAVPAAARQAVAARLGFSETVFVDDPATAALRIHTPTVDLPLAGHPLVGTSWLLARAGAAVDTLRPPAGAVPTWVEGELTWIRARLEWATLYDVAQLPAVADVDAFDVPGGDAMVAVWAWDDEAGGRVRARVFPNGIGIAEDEATGAAALQLGALIGRAIAIRQGAGSELHARPDGDGAVAVGGRVALVSERAHWRPTLCSSASRSRRSPPPGGSRRSGTTATGRAWTPTRTPWRSTSCGRPAARPGRGRRRGRQRGQTLRGPHADPG